MKYGMLAIILVIGLSSLKKPVPASDWVSLFDGKSLNGWKVGNNAETFSIENGTISVHGKTAHLYYVGDYHQHNFKNFEFKAKVMTRKGANSGIYFHTQYQESGWPDKGYEVQVNNTQGDWRRTGSLYGVVDVKEGVKDDEWFTEYIKVVGKHVTIKVNDKTTVEYDEPANPEHLKEWPGRLISSGTFAIQGHDPGSQVYYKDIMVKVLPD